MPSPAWRTVNRDIAIHTGMASQPRMDDA